MLTADVAVVGAGPGGAAAAIVLARAGRRVILVDRARFPRDKCCGDGLTAGALRRLETLGLRPAAVPSWQPVDEVQVRSPSGRTVRYPLPRDRGTFAAVARRWDLDAALVDVARAAGVDVHEGHGLRGAAWGTPGDPVVLDVEGLGAVAAPYTIGADGMWSPLRKALDVGEEPGYLGEWHAFRQYFTGVDRSGANRMLVWFEADLLPGYAWAFPLPGGRTNVGFGIQRGPGRSVRAMKEQWADLLRRTHIRQALGDAVPEGPHRAWPIPARVERTRLVGAGGRALFVGDAARATDPMTGEGIGQALEMGMLAAEAVLAAGPQRPSSAGLAYEEGVHRGLAVDNRLAAVLSRALRHRRGARGAIRVSGATEWSRGHFARWLLEDYPRALLVTPRRWHRGMLGGTGAYVDGAARR